MASFDLCEAVRQTSGVAPAPNSAQQAKHHGRALVGGWERAGSWSCAQLGQLFSTFLCPPHSGTGLPWFSSQPHGKGLNGGPGDTDAPSSTSAPALGEACGKVALGLFCGSRRTHCSWDMGVHTVRA